MRVRDSPRYAAIFEAWDNRMSRPRKNPLIVVCVTPVRLASSFAESPLLRMASRRVSATSLLMGKNTTRNTTT